ncbi:MAG: hypothetical protein RLZZ416_175 [Candidatus Parcubacteria bacterium]|jgi:HAD superfamily hydrolase (TIGR01484 family)
MPNTKHVFFDLDNTLTPSRQPMKREHGELFARLCEQKDVVAVSGQELKSFHSQLPAAAAGRYYVLAQVGNHAYAKDGSTLWEEKPNAEQTDLVLAFIRKLRQAYPREIRDENDIVELRGSLIGYSLIGHHEDPVKKAALDPGSVGRKKMLAAFGDDVKRLHDAGIDVTPAGTTTIEFFLAGKNKGFNIKRLLAHERWRADESLYIGDELEPGRNDESVIGIVPTHAVRNPDETFDFIKNNLLS